MDDRRDWVRSVMLPVIGLSALVGSLVGCYLAYESGKPPPDKLLSASPLEGACFGAVAFALPAWAVLWSVWLVRHLRE